MLLVMVLGACASSPARKLPRPEEFARSVLVIREEADGRVTHAWRDASEVEIVGYHRPLGLTGNLQHVSIHDRDCHAEYMECVRECMSRPLARGQGHITAGRGLGGKEQYCNARCLKPYNDCEELKRLKPREFSTWDEATQWLTRNRALMVMGGTVVIAGVTFVVVAASAGLLILAPAVLLTSADVRPLVPGGAQ